MTKAEALTRRSVVDEYADLVAETTPWKAKIARRDELAKIIRDWYVTAAAEQAHVAEGDRFHVILSPMGNETVVDKVAAWAALGRKKFIEAAGLTITALKGALPAATVSTLTSKTQTGSRTLTVQAAPVAAAAQEAAA